MIKVELYKTTTHPFALEAISEITFGAKTVAKIGWVTPEKNAVILTEHTILTEPQRCFAVFEATNDDIIKFLAGAPQGCVTYHGLYGLTIDMDKYAKLERTKAEIAALCGEEYTFQYDMPPNPAGMMNDC